MPVALVVTTAALDQITKWWALDALDDGDVIEIAPTLEFDLAFNSGFSFGTGAGFGRWIGVLVVILCGVLVQQLLVSETRVRATIVAIVLGGAIGNLIDRVFRGDDGFLSGEVIDFIDVTWYAVFNLADIFVVCGCIAFGAHELLGARDAARAEADHMTERDDDGTADDTEPAEEERAT